MKARENARGGETESRRSREEEREKRRRARGAQNRETYRGRDILVSE